MWHGKEKKQAGAELCQAQWKLGLAKLDLPSMYFFIFKKTLRSFSNCQQIDVVFFCTIIEVIFHLNEN
jgi:hypothetical protein